MGSGHKVKSTQSKLKLSYGTGSFEDYIPWIEARFGSVGVTYECRGNIIKRPYTFVSRGEYLYFNLLEFQSGILDIREQYPLLDMNLIKKVAYELGIFYPEVSGSPIVMSTDFYILYKSGKKAVRTIKYSSDSIGTKEENKFSIEKEYFRRKGITDWKVVLRTEIDKTFKAENLAQIRNYYDADRFIRNLDGDINRYEHLCNSLVRHLMIDNNFMETREIIRCFTTKEGITFNFGVQLFNHLIIRKMIILDLEKKLDIRTLNQMELGVNVQEILEEDMNYVY